MEAADLLLAYTRRRQFEARLLAKELAEMMTPKVFPSRPQRMSNGRQPNHVHADVLLREMGVTIQ